MYLLLLKKKKKNSQPPQKLTHKQKDKETVFIYCGQRFKDLFYWFKEQQVLHHVLVFIKKAETHKMLIQSPKYGSASVSIIAILENSGICKQQVLV